MLSVGRRLWPSGPPEGRGCLVPLVRSRTVGRWVGGRSVELKWCRPEPNQGSIRDHLKGKRCAPVQQLDLVSPTAASRDVSQSVRPSVRATLTERLIARPLVS